jgi:hypothetical protein
MMQAVILRSTIAKQSTAPAKNLESQFKTQLKPGNYDIVRWEHTTNGHHKVTFVSPIAGYQTWVVWGDDIEYVGGSKELILKVPYYSQRDNQQDWWRTCSTSTHAMILNYLKPGSVASDDEYLQKYVEPVGDTTIWSVHTAALQQFGIESEFRTNLDFEDLTRSLELGYPVAIGIMHKGTIQAPAGGHVLAIIGMDQMKGVFYANDPWGAGFDYFDYDGQEVEYPIQPSLDRRWLVEGANSGYGRIITAIDGKSTGLV